MADRDETLERAIELMQVEANNFGLRFIKDGKVRADYAASIKRYGDEIRAAVSRGEISAADAATHATDMRNQILEMARLKSSDIGRAGAEKMKAQGASLETLLERYAKRLYQKPFAELGEAERNAVFLEIVESSGRANPRVTIRSLRLARLGRGLLVISAGVAIYNIATSDHPGEQAVEEGVSFGGGILGGAAGGAAAGLLFGPGAVIAVPVGAFLGGIAGALGADMAFHWLRGR